MDQGYTLSTSKRGMIQEDYDVIILGTGIAGLFTALNIDLKLRVLLITKTTMKISNSRLAQGGIATSKNLKIHYDDTIKAGVNYNNKKAVEILTTGSNESINKLISYGVDFDRDEEGNLLYTREGGHTQKNVLHIKDETGKEITNTLVKEVGTRRNITIKENTFVIDILTSQQEVKGVIAVDNQNQYRAYMGKSVIVSTGGIGQLYSNTTNEKITTGDGIAMAYRAGAKLKDLEFIQFHPTSFYQKHSQQRFLISEAVRGEGAILRNIKGEAFMGRYHEMKDLAPRDIVARAIFQEMVKSNYSHVFLDITHRGSDYIKNRFPMIYNRCLSFGIDMTRDMIPVAPAEHYIMGGVDTDLYGRTNIKNLYACGECACNGVHGANRLASNSLLEGIVFANRVAISVNNSCLNLELNGVSINNEDIDKLLVSYRKSIEVENNKNYNKIIKDNNLSEIENHLKETMNEYVSIVRDIEGLMVADMITYRLMEELNRNPQNNIQYYQLGNMITVARLIIKAAYRRRESLGAHYLVDGIYRKEDIIC